MLGSVLRQGGSFDLPLQTTPSGIRAGCASSAFGRHFRDGDEQEVPLVTGSKRYGRHYGCLGWRRGYLEFLGGPGVRGIRTPQISILCRRLADGGRCHDRNPGNPTKCSASRNCYDGQSLTACGSAVESRSSKKRNRGLDPVGVLAVPDSERHSCTGLCRLLRVRRALMGSL